MLAGAASAQDGDVAAGKELFTAKAEPPCAVCHTLADAESTGEVGPNFDELKPSMERVINAVRDGIGVMPSYAETLSEDQIKALAAYVSSTAGKK